MIGGTGVRIRKLAIATGRKLQHVHLRGLPRLMYLSGRLVGGRGVEVIESVEGVQLAVDVRDYASCMMLYGRFGSELVALLKKLVKPGDSVVDVGAHLGYITSHLAVLVGASGTVYSFEPDPSAIEQLQSTVKANGHYWVKTFAIAASDHEGDIEFYLSPVLGWSTAVAGTHLSDLTKVTVKCVPLDTLLRDGEIRKPVTLVKIDVEGYENVVLRGMQSLISENRPLIILEINPVLLRANNHTTADVLGQIFAHDYQIYRVQLTQRFLRREAFQLIPEEKPIELKFCDVLCVPRERTLPAELRGLVKE